MYFLFHHNRHHLYLHHRNIFPRDVTKLRRDRLSPLQVRFLKVRPVHGCFSAITFITACIAASNVAFVAASDVEFVTAWDAAFVSASNATL